MNISIREATMTVQKTIKLNNGSLIPSIALGTWKLSTSIASDVIYEALQIGYRHIDTAILYGNEKEIGEGIARWLEDGNKREDVFYTTKLWTFNDYSQAKSEIKRALGAVESNIGYIDLLLLHSPVPGPKGRLEAWKALQEVVKTGKVKNIGVSSWGEEHLTQLFNWDGLEIKPVVNQIELSPWCMREQLVEFCKKNDIVLEAYSPLAQGSRFSDPAVVKVAKKYDVTPAQVLIRWSLEKGYIPLPKSQNVKRLKSNLDVFGFELTKEEIEELSHPDEHDPLDWDVVNVE